MKRFSIIWLGLFAAVLLAGCQLPRSINWNSRIGNYTFDQAIIEMGPPDSQARLSDGWVVAKWVKRYSTGATVIANPGLYPYPGGAVVETGPSYYESALILTFNTNNVLAAWARR